MNFIRLQNLTVNYNFPAKLITKLRLSALKMYLQGNNLALWTKTLDRDPTNVDATGGINYRYPSPRTFSIGINASF